MSTKIRANRLILIIRSCSARPLTVARASDELVVGLNSLAVVFSVGGKYSSGAKVRFALRFELSIDELAANSKRSATLERLIAAVDDIANPWTGAILLKTSHRWFAQTGQWSLTCDVTY